MLPIALGTVLRQRYVVQQVLGQGGFGRTYLALDRERFDEPCVVKEFVVPYQDEALVEKSKLLFQREASILYQIQHPQVPRFWASFQDDHRLFLVQDFVVGKTYRQLLNERKQTEQVFSETEVRHFLKHMLDVLSYIHDRGIIHRDITPENIILRSGQSAQADQSAPGLPVLIDFGAVKEATTHWPLVTTPTQVGKVGYAPTEQLQTGTVYPNSDLYALAATSLALLTGREPRTLLDSRLLTWCWQPYATVSDALGDILTRMLAMYPGDRYQSAQAVLLDLQPLVEAPVAVLSGRIPLAVTTLESEKAATRLTVSHGTLSASEPSGKVPLPPAKESAVPTPTSPLSHSPTPRSWSFKPSWAIAASVLVALGVATPVLWRLRTDTADTGNSSNKEVWVSGAKLPQAEASRIIAAQGSNAAFEPPRAADRDHSPLSGKPPQMLQFAPGKNTTVVQDALQPNEVQPYWLEAAEGQIMTVTLTGDGVTMNLLRSNQAAIDVAAYQTRSWTGQLPARDRYLIQVSGAGSYSLDVAITPLSRPTQDQTQRVKFTRGETGTTVTGAVAPRQVRRYLLSAKQGQILALKVLQGKVNLSAIAPNGQRIGGSATQSPNWQGRLPADGDYVIEVTAQKADNYALSLEVF